MLLIADIAVFILLGIILVQDLRERKIAATLIPLLLSGFIFRGIYSGSAAVLLAGAGINLTFILLQFLLLVAYFSLKNRKLTNIIDSHIGLGDILFFVVLSAAFSPLNFIFFYVLSLLFSLLGMIVYRTSGKMADREIPLAGTVSSVLMIALMISYCVPLNFYDDAGLIQMLGGQ
jgi:hypothetical protein